MLVQSKLESAGEYRVLVDGKQVGHFRYQRNPINRMRDHRTCDPKGTLTFYGYTQTHDLSECIDLEEAKKFAADRCRERFWFFDAPATTFDAMSDWWERFIETNSLPECDALEMTYKLQDKPEHIIAAVYAFNEAWHGVESLRDEGFEYVQQDTNLQHWELVTKGGAILAAKFDWHRKRWTVSKRIVDGPFDWILDGIRGDSVRALLKIQMNA